MALTLKADTAATLAKLSRLQRRPAATIAAELIEEMTPKLEQIAALLEAAHANRHSLPEATADKLANLEAILRHTSNFALERLAEAVEPPKRRKRRK